MRDVAKFFITIVVWIICGMIAVGPMIDAGLSSGGVLLAIVALIAAFSTTNMFWSNGEDKDEKAETSKQKRSSSDVDPQVQLLLSLMDDNERAEMKARLQDHLLDDSTARLRDDGEIPTSLESLLEDIPHQANNR